MSDQPRTLGQAIRARRQALGLTQEELAARIGNGIRQTEISRLERGKVGLPRRERLVRIANALDIEPGELLAASGWAGADQAFHRPELQVSPTDFSATPSVYPAVSQDIARLRSAVDQSRTIQEQTRQLLRNSSRNAALWMAGFDDRRSRSETN